MTAERAVPRESSGRRRERKQGGGRDNPYSRPHKESRAASQVVSSSIPLPEHLRVLVDCHTVGLVGMAGRHNRKGTKARTCTLP